MMSATRGPAMNRKQLAPRVIVAAALTDANAYRSRSGR
jgi:hypothetical protein